MNIHIDWLGYCVLLGVPHVSPSNTRGYWTYKQVCCVHSVQAYVSLLALPKKIKKNIYSKDHKYILILLLFIKHWNREDDKELKKALSQ